ncbi:tetratricopeptide repeat protein [Odoribacter lunatus]|uniref:tetratricopeptide repeat protein n=1 Tax=Odoribacter lunatus TaxID=2941335 RepID=UPI002040E591|nr:tetratricopeptide repeat protein [Odoribacter lunatus]
MEEYVEVLIAEGKLEEAIAVLERKCEQEEEEEMLLLLGELYYKKGKSIQALNKFNAVLRKNPDNIKAHTYVTMINNILNFYHKDLLNP